MGEEVEKAEVSSPVHHCCSRVHCVLSHTCRRKRSGERIRKEGCSDPLLLFSVLLSEVC
jgi:hypothetical protein